MGDIPDKTENIYCKNCQRVTLHNIYKKTRDEIDQEVVYGSLSQYTRTVDIRTYTTRKQVCTVCGKTKKRTTRDDCCQII